MQNDSSRYADRINVYIDFQNSYEAARSVFHTPGDLGRAGTFHPLALAKQLTKKSGFDRRLGEVRVYRGMPAHQHDPLTHEAASRQVERWRRGGVTVVTRPLAYHQNRRGGVSGHEKGIDVSLAIDLLEDALDDVFDVAVVVSCDTDIAPAIERVLARTEKRIEVVGWRGPHGTSNRLGVEHKRLWAHWIDEELYEHVKDGTNYLRPLAGELDVAVEA